MIGSTPLAARLSAFPSGKKAWAALLRSIAVDGDEVAADLSSVQRQTFALGEAPRPGDGAGGSFPPRLVLKNTCSPRPVEALISFSTASSSH